MGWKIIFFLLKMRPEITILENEEENPSNNNEARSFSYDIIYIILL